jgi:hypothetical protein
MTDKPYVVRYFKDDTIGVVSRERTRLVAEQVMMEFNDAGWSVDVTYDPCNLWVEKEWAHA